MTATKRQPRVPRIGGVVVARRRSAGPMRHRSDRRAKEGKLGAVRGEQRDELAVTWSRVE